MSARAVRAHAWCGMGAVASVSMRRSGYSSQQRFSFVPVDSLSIKRLCSQSTSFSLNPSYSHSTKRLCRASRYELKITSAAQSTHLRVEGYEKEAEAAPTERTYREEE